MSTIKLYEQDVCRREFDATVLSCTPKGEGWLVSVDQTCFYPEGGGQPWDTGHLGEARVSEVHIREGVVYHTTDRPLEPGTVVHGEIDWQRRFDLMQQHSGEHIVSGIIHSLYGLDNVGFHMGTDVVTVDWNGDLSWQQLQEAERLANQVIWQNQPTEITVPDPEELEHTAYRSKKALEWPVRIVSFPGADACACCGTHVLQAGQIGMIKLISVVRMRGGIRLEMVCGGRAMAYCARIQAQNHRTSVLLSAKEGVTADAVQRLYDEHQQLKLEHGALQTAYFRLFAEQYRGKGDCVVFADCGDTGALRRLAVAIMEVCGGTCRVFLANGGDSFAYCVGQQDGDVRQAVSDMNRALQGRGGGRGGFAQGTVRATEEQILAYFGEASQD